MSSFSLQLNYSVEGCQKELLEASTMYLSWISSQAGTIQCALCLWNKLLFPLCKGKYLREFASQAVWSHKVAENCVCRAHNPAGWCCMGWCVPLVLGQTAWWKEQELVQPQPFINLIMVVPSLTSSWSQVLTFLITGNCFITLPEENRSTKQWLCASKHCVCRRAEQWLLIQLLWACRTVQLRFLFSQAGCACSCARCNWLTGSSMLLSQCTCPGAHWHPAACPSLARCCTRSVPMAVTYIAKGVQEVKPEWSVSQEEWAKFALSVEDTEETTLDTSYLLTSLGSRE